MKTFPPVLNRILSTASFNAARLCQETEISEGNFSRIRAGSKNVSQDVLARLLNCPLFSSEDRRLLLLAYLRDEVPSGFEHEVVINLPETSRLHETPIDPLSEAIGFLADRAITDVELQNMIISLHKLLSQG